MLAPQEDLLSFRRLAMEEEERSDLSSLVPISSQAPLAMELEPTLDSVASSSNSRTTISSSRVHINKEDRPRTITRTTSTSTSNNPVANKSPSSDSRTSPMPVTEASLTRKFCLTLIITKIFGVTSIIPRLSYETGNGIQANAQGQLKQIGGAAGIAIQGAFSYPGDDGQNYALTYTADENGYRPVGAHLPTPPPIPEEIQKSLELIARNPPQGAENGAYIHSNEGSYNHQSGAGGYGQQQQQGSYQQGGHHQASFSGHTSGFGGQQQQHNFGGQHGSFGAASTATSQQYLPPKNQQQGFSGYKY